MIAAITGVLPAHLENAESKLNQQELYGHKKNTLMV